MDLDIFEIPPGGGLENVKSSTFQNTPKGNMWIIVEFRPTPTSGLHISGWNFPCDLVGPLGWFVDFDFFFQNLSNWFRNSSPIFQNISKAIIGVPSAECHCKDKYSINDGVTCHRHRLTQVPTVPVIR